MNRDARYSLLMLLLTAAVLVPIVAANYLVGLYVVANTRLAVLAHAWQRETRGTVSIPPVAELSFKRLVLRDRSASIDAVVLSSSTLTTVQSSALGRAEGEGFYNLALSNNYSRFIAGDAAFVVDWMPDVRLLIVGLDWATDQGVFIPGEVMTRAGGLSGDPDEGPPVWEQLADALAWPRVVQLYDLARGWANGDAKVRDLHDLPDQPAYCLERGACPPDHTCKDFDTSRMLVRHACLGFRWDGSANISAYGHFSHNDELPRIMAPYLGIDRYERMMRVKGRPNMDVLESLAASARRMRQRHGEMIVVLPPMLPGLVRALLKQPSTAEYAALAKRTFAEWAAREGVAVIDANASEDYGCTQEDFFDSFHGSSACQNKVFASFRATHQK